MTFLLFLGVDGPWMAVSWPWIGVDWRVKNLPLECMVGLRENDKNFLMPIWFEHKLADTLVCGRPVSGLHKLIPFL